jgi:hypothetical protein
MTPQTSPVGASRGIQSVVQALAALMLIVGVWLAVVGLYLLESRTTVLDAGIPRGGLGFWYFGPLRSLGLQDCAFLSAVAGFGFIFAASMTWVRWSPAAIRQFVAAVTFLPALWLVVFIVQIIPDSVFGLRIAAIAAALLIRKGCYALADALSRTVFGTTRQRMLP